MCLCAATARVRPFASPSPERVLTGWVGAYKRGPFGGGLFEGRPRGLLIEIVEKREGMRGRRPRGRLEVRALMRTFGGP